MRATTILITLVSALSITPTLAAVYDLKCDNMTICGKEKNSGCSCSNTGVLSACSKLPNCRTQGGCRCVIRDCKKWGCPVMKKRGLTDFSYIDGAEQIEEEF